MNPKLYELMIQAGYSAPNLAPRNIRFTKLLLTYLLEMAPRNSRIAEEILDLLDPKPQ